MSIKMQASFIEYLVPSVYFIVVPAQLSFFFFKLSVRVVIKGKMLRIGLSDSLSIHDMSGFQFVNQTVGESEKLVAAYHFRYVTHLYDIHVSCLLMEYRARNAGLILSVYK